jgi:hypothetical protein
MNKNEKIGLFVALGFFAAIVFKPKKKKDDNNGGGGVDWTNPQTATISYNEALKMAEAIKKSVGYVSVSWTDISKEFLKLRNDKDVEILYKAFGDWDGPKFVNGDLFNALNAAYTPYVDNILGNEQALKIIKQYSFSYSKYFQW